MAGINYGIARPGVNILEDSLPKITQKSQTYNFDVSAFQWNALNNSPFISPLLVEQVQSDEGTFAVCFPEKRKYFVHNTLDPSTSALPATPPGTESSLSGSGDITWTPVNNTGPALVGYINDVISDFPSYYD